jgi:hypothetical protein
MRRYAPRPLLKQLDASFKSHRLPAVLRLAALLLRFLPAWLRALWLEARLRVQLAFLRQA